jgi:hypothetical protein
MIGAAGAQQREIGILGGGGFLNGVPVQGAGVLIGQDRYSRWSGEIRYLFEQRDLRITSGGTTARFSGQAHALHYDLVFHTRPRTGRVRPYVAIGGGIKIFRGTGAETAYRPLMEYVYLTRTQELKPMLTAGGGVKFQLGRRMTLRGDFRDQVTPFPRKVIAPAPGMALDGWLHDFVPTVGVSWRF